MVTETKNILMPDFTEDALSEESKFYGETMSRKVAEGEKRANAFMVKVIRGKKIGHKRFRFGEDLINGVNERAMYFYPGWAGNYRDSEKQVGGHQSELAKNLSYKMYKFGIWLEEEVDSFINIDNADLRDGLRVGAATHYTISFMLQPYEDGNKRTARIVTNGILILGSDEFRISKSLAVPPIPVLHELVVEPISVLSNQPNIKKIKEQLASGKSVKADPYGRSLEQVYETQTLNPLELHLANMWDNNLKKRLDIIYQNIGKNGRNEADARLIRAFETRLQNLDIFRNNQEAGKNELDLVPDFAAPKYIV